MWTVAQPTSPPSLCAQVQWRTTCPQKHWESLPCTLTNWTASLLVFWVFRSWPASFLTLGIVSRSWQSMIHTSPIPLVSSVVVSCWSYTFSQSCFSGGLDIFVSPVHFSPEISYTLKLSYHLLILLNFHTFNSCKYTVNEETSQLHTVCKKQTNKQTKNFFSFFTSHTRISVNKPRSQAPRSYPGEPGNEAKNLYQLGTASHTH